MTASQWKTGASRINVVYTLTQTYTMKTMETEGMEVLQVFRAPESQYWIHIFQNLHDIPFRRHNDRQATKLNCLTSTARFKLRNISLVYTMKNLLHTCILIVLNLFACCTII